MPVAPAEETAAGEESLAAGAVAPSAEGDRPVGLPAPAVTTDCSPSPEPFARSLWKRDYVGRITLAVLGVVAAYLLVRGALFVDARPHTAVRLAIRLAARPLVGCLVLTGGALAAIALGRALRRLLVHYDVSATIGTAIYRLLVLAAAVAFFAGIVQLLWIPLVLALVAYLVYDVLRSVSRPPLAERDPLLRRPLACDVEAALRILRQPGVRTVVLGHTHKAEEVHLGDGRRFINTGTWVRHVDVRHVRGDRGEINPYCRVQGGVAELMSWRGTEPSRPLGPR
jgi:hypothetical protein